MLKQKKFSGDHLHDVFYVRIPFFHSYRSIRDSPWTAPHIPAPDFQTAPFSPQKMYDKPTKGKEKHDAGPKDPFVLLGPPLHHADRVAADAQRVGDAVQLPLSALEHLPLLTQIAQHGSTTLEIFVQLRIGRRHEALLPQHVRFARLVRWRRAKRE